MIDTTVLHARIAGAPLDYLRELFGPDVKPAGPDQWRVGRRGSLAITIRDGALVYFSHEDGTGGDAVALWQRLRGGTAGDALKAAASWAQVSETPRHPAAPAKADAPAPAPTEPNRARLSLTWPQTMEAHAMSKRLAEDTQLCERIARARGWSPETIRRAACDGVLGWCSAWSGRHTGALAFVYRTGIKQRWRKQSDRVIRWSVGGPASLWREAMILPVTRKVFLTEGETDALSLLDAGAEPSPEVVVAALPSAGVIPPGLAEKLAGREVILCLDNDPAGQAASAKVAALIEPAVASLKVWRAPK